MKIKTPTLPSKKSQCAITAAVLGLSMVSSSHLHAATLYWDGGDGAWPTLGNWSTDSGATTPDPLAEPGASDDVVFNITSANNVNQEVSLSVNNRSANSILLNNAGTTFFRRAVGDGTSASFLQVGTGGFTMSSTSGAVTLGQNVNSGQKVGLRAATGSTSLSITNDSSSLLTLNQGTQTRTGDINLASTIIFAGSGSGGINQVGAIGKATASDGSVAVTVNRSGTGVVTFEGTNNYTGATTVTAGTLLINGSTHASSAVSVAAGTLTGVPVAMIGGNGTINGTLTLAGESDSGFKNGGVLSPGSAAGDIQTLNAGTTTWNGGSIWDFDLSSIDNTSDKLNITGDFVKGSGSVFEFDFKESTPFWGETYVLAQWSGSLTDFLESDFSYTGLGAGSYNDSFFAITGSTLTFTAIPEPTTALAGILLAAGLLRRRRVA